MFWRRKPPREEPEAVEALEAAESATTAHGAAPADGATPADGVRSAPDAPATTEEPPITDDELEAEALAAGVLEPPPFVQTGSMPAPATLPPATSILDDAAAPATRTDDGSGAEAAPEEPEGDLVAGLERSRGGFMARLHRFLGGGDTGGPDWDDVEETLIAGDVGGALALEVVERARARRDPGGSESAVMAELAALLVPRDPHWQPRPATEGGPAVVLVVGVNGTGKTTTIGKLASRYRHDGKRVVLAAADTFRAAAIDQLGIWARRADAEMVAHAPGADPGAVVYDAIDAAIARHADVVIADTAGRLHTKTNLMDELAKIRRIVDKRLPGSTPETLFVLDATTGQNGLAQAKAFHDAVGLTGIVLTKLDSTSKGGIVFAIEDALQVPVRFVGVGEGVHDLLPFDPDTFVEALFA